MLSLGMLTYETRSWITSRDLKELTVIEKASGVPYERLVACHWPIRRARGRSRGALSDNAGCLRAEAQVPRASWIPFGTLIASIPAMHPTIPAPLPFSADVLDRMIQRHPLSEVLAFAAAMAQNAALEPCERPSTLPPGASTVGPPGAGGRYSSGAAEGGDHG